MRSLAQEAVWTCEIDPKARSSHRDAVPGCACKFTNIEGFINAKDLASMKAVKNKSGGKKFEKWLHMVKHAKFETKGHCAEHLRLCRWCDQQHFFV